MSKPFDYSKWDKIELSDDEEDVHPNIDRESWFRMKHRSRVEREEHEEKDKQRIIAEVCCVSMCVCVCVCVCVF
jgi:cell division cycle protein 37